MKVIRHHNYGKAMESMPDKNNKIIDLFHFCLFELDNGRKIYMHTFKTYNDKKDTYEWSTFFAIDENGKEVNLGEYSVHYADDYKFGEEFSDWFERMQPWTKDIKYPTDEEEKCVIDYYKKNIKFLN